MSEKLVFARLNNQNFPVWKMRMEMYLKREELWSAVSVPKPEPVTAAWTKADEKALATIVLGVEDGQLNLVRGAKTALEAWNQLKAFHETTSMTSRVALLRRLCSTNMSEGGDIAKHLFELEELFDRLASAGQALETSLKIAMIYRSLPESYGSLVTALESRPDADQTMALVKQKLIDEHQRRQERSADGGEKAMKARMHEKKKSEKVCYHCGKPGHFRRNCEQLLREDQNSAAGAAKKSGSVKAKQATETVSAICFAAGTKCSGLWIVDSGCSSHMTNEKIFFDELDTTVRVKVVMADGSETMSEGIGAGIVKCVNGEGSFVDIPFKDVLYVPSLDCGLLSVRKLVNKGLKVEFSDGRCEIRSPQGGVVASAKRRGNLFALEVAEEARLSKEARQLQNRRFVDRDPTVLDEIRENELTEDFKEQDCGDRLVRQHCLAGKSKFPFPETVSQRVLDVIHMSVCGPMVNVTPGGARYLMTIVDDYSRYTVVCFLKQRREVADCIERFVAYVKNKFGRAPSVIRSDSEDECHELRRFYEQEGIRAEYTKANSSQQTRVAECQNRLLQQIATCMLRDADLDRKYWGEAVATAAYLENRSPSHAVDRTPFERWFGRKPTLGRLKEFGCPALVHTLDGRAKKLLFVGYHTEGKAYRFLDTETDAITISRRAQFTELQEESPTSGGLPLTEELIELEFTANKAEEQVEEVAPIEPEAEGESEEEHFIGWFRLLLTILWSLSPHFDWDNDEEQPDQTEVTEPAEERSIPGVLLKQLVDTANAAILMQEEPVPDEEVVFGSGYDFEETVKAMVKARFKYVGRGTTQRRGHLDRKRCPLHGRGVCGSGGGYAMSTRKKSPKLEDPIFVGDPASPALYSQNIEEEC